MAIPTPETQFTRDILGNYACNTFAEAAGSGPFDVIIVGGGTFGLSLAQDLFFRSQRFGPGSDPQDTLRPLNYRILVLEGGPFVLPEHTQDLPNFGLFGPGTQPSASSALPATRQELIAQGKDKQAILENRGAAMEFHGTIRGPRILPGRPVVVLRWLVSAVSRDGDAHGSGRVYHVGYALAGGGSAGLDT